MNLLTTITDEELISINNAIQSRYGLDFTNYEPTSIKRRILRIIHKHNLSDVVGLWRKLLYDKNFIIEFKDDISVGMTEMFRNPETWVMLREEILPSYNDKSQIDVWHAGCATGEEVDSMAIVLHESGQLSKANGFATDLSDRFIHVAKSGIYELDLINKYEKNYRLYNEFGTLKKYFTIEGEQGEIKPYLKKYSEYKQHNLTQIKQ